LFSDIGPHRGSEYAGKYSERILMTNVSPTTLLTAEDVAEILRVGIRTVYKHSKKMGGFYPFGMKCLRFNKVVFYECLERQSKELLSVWVPLQQTKDNRVRIQDKAGSECSRSRTKERIESITAAMASLEGKFTRKLQTDTQSDTQKSKKASGENAKSL